jgi:hypothetical protein
MKQYLFLLLNIVFRISAVNGQLQENYVDSIGQKQGDWVEYRVLPSKIIINDLYPKIVDGDSVLIMYDHKIFDERSEIVSCVGKYKDGLKIGLWKEFYSNDTLKSEVEYRNGIPFGSCKLFWKNGNLKMQCEIEKEERVRVVCFDTDGTMVVDTIAKKSGIIKSIYED